MTKREENKTVQQKKPSQAERLRERKLAACQAHIRLAEAEAAEAEERLAALAEASVEGLVVCHKRYGEGVVRSQERSTVKVRFACGEKRFVMPAAFLDGFLTTENAEMQQRIAAYRAAEAARRKARNVLHAARHAELLLKEKRTGG